MLIVEQDFRSKSYANVHTEIRAEYTDLPVSNNLAVSRFVNRFRETVLVTKDVDVPEEKLGDHYRVYQLLLQYLKQHEYLHRNWVCPVRAHTEGC